MAKLPVKFSDNAMKVLCKRYFIDKKGIVCPNCGKEHETPEQFIERCSFGREDFYNLLASLDFLPGSPTLFNAGTNQGTFSSCFKFDVEDSLVSIEEVDRKSALVQKWGGGVGYCLSALRPRGTPIRSTQGSACGPVAVIKKYQATSLMITQGGKREGAQMGVLICTHPDIREFIHCKDKDPQALSTFNLSVACTDTFMKQVCVPGTEEEKLLREMAESTWKTGDPGLYFIDTAEATNPTPWLGKLTGTNPCGEVPLLDNEPCNIGSINLTHMVELEAFNFKKLKIIARLATRYLDTVLENNTFPVEEITQAALRTRKLGLGVMGWADTLALLHINYDTKEAVELSNKVMKTILHAAEEESKLLWQENGPCPAYSDIGNTIGSEHPMRRNTTLTCIAPAGTIAVIAGCSSGIEPHFTLEGSRVMGDGKTILREGTQSSYGTFVPKTAHEVNWEWHIRMQAAFQEHTDLAVSKTINVPESITKEEIFDAFVTAWKSKCKGVTIYRDKSRDVQVLVNKGDENRLYGSVQTLSSARKKMPITGTSIRHKFSVGGNEGYLHIGQFADGTPGELFIRISKQGSTISGLLDGLGILTSMALQYGVPLSAIVSKMAGTRFEPSGLTENKDIPTTTSLLDYIFRFMALDTDSEQPITQIESGMLCPDCQSSAILEEGCLVCSKKCGWSRCG